MLGSLELAAGVGLVGHDGWADARLGDYERSYVMMNDYKLIAELAGMSKVDRWPVLKALGDQAAVIPSFSGDGMSIALHSAKLAAECYLRGEGSQAYQERLAAHIARQVRRATVLSRSLVSAGGQRLAIAAAFCVPSVMILGAALTRIPARAIFSRTGAA